MVEPLRHRQTKGAATDMFYLTSPRHISTLPILAVENVAHSEKLVWLRVDFGDHACSILVGMKKERPSPKEIEDWQALFVVNLAPLWPKQA